MGSLAVRGHILSAWNNSSAGLHGTTGRGPGWGSGPAKRLTQGECHPAGRGGSTDAPEMRSHMAFQEGVRILGGRALAD